MIDPSEFAQAAIGQRVEVVDFPDWRLEVPYKGRSMPYRTFDRLRRVTETAVLENKRLGDLLTLIRQSQEAGPPGMRTSKGPKRRDQTKHMFSVG
jgi:hypothetical protein